MSTQSNPSPVRTHTNPEKVSQAAAAQRAAPLAGTGFGSARSFMLLSVAAAVVTIGLKLTAFLLTDSVGLFSDAAESLINLIAALAALAALTVAERPADAEHAYGHTKAE